MIYELVLEELDLYSCQKYSVHVPTRTHTHKGKREQNGANNSLSPNTTQKVS